MAAGRKDSFFGYWFALRGWVEWVGGWGISRALFLSLLFIGLLSILSIFIPNLTSFLTGWLIGTAPVWLPIMLIFAAWGVWMSYIQNLWRSKLDTVLLEIKLPRDIMKSPRAMEIAITGFHITSGEITYIQRHWTGSTRPFFSFEFASFNGEVHMYVWVWEQYRTVVESQLYAQYPDIELYEVEDYASVYQFNPETHICFCTDHAYTPRSDAYPIKTYIDYELDKDPKEEFKIDPLAQVFEALSAMKQGESMWLQIVFWANARDKRRKKGAWLRWENRWENDVKDEVELIRRASATPWMDESGIERRGFPNPTWSQREQMQTMERNLGKLPFDVGIRGVYIADKKVFSGPALNSLRQIWRPFNNPGYLNQLRPTRGMNIFDYPWQDWKRIRWLRVTQRYFDAYRRRSYLTRPYVGPTQVMTPEILATIFHPPSRTIEAPGLARISATKAEAPANLPK
ncbi:hypothetical protein A2673_01100 [Candidatus Kaiserbacteria bacterium RIFCSPHIGHO2_01_FULL_50_13]|uniref:DUF8128 domain-containing protein n=1 Tax=Candidatus Kaiserbacteria bacterium RIFCSPLOWO2_01_FULL_50_24 TaxID=1798507 RepID=A0A1F6EMR2_9BACT|nr:MAG: hypothetical protein A2673_01100 [Candidatus Kaiserbacteria bacterium RIFCSPHIGHO2_01_FULL_50_13]OGG74927.1 MAG: hypothetical protein A3A34_03870 [Candidatus Kaiserbacteria bacterium RIFCSPLOWO2_01_FULL_50_24]OGG82243.1 MAG: hypothetical protein A3H74_03545 [Candidatus Kaiserbacteria bacterium RIFCSPLOWO2_02_FULL_51_13]